jgi:DNA-binding FrmR family transcriptional regulator
MAASAVAVILCAATPSARSQESVAQKIERLDGQMTRVQAQLEQSENELKEIQQQLSALRSQAGLPAKSVADDTAISGAANLAAAVDELREKQDVLESQAAAQEQSKVGSESRYPVTLSGMILFNGFVNTRAVDVAPTPAMALPGPGATGATVRQSVLGIDASGPHLFGASSHADLRIDFDGAELTGNYANAVGFVRFRTAHAGLDWQHAKAFFSLDRPIISPDSPTSLTAVAEPALAWSGNLWTWNPQAGVSEELPIHRNAALQMEAALIDVADPFNPNANSSSSPVIPPSTAEQSRWPGAEARLSLLDPINDSAAHLGISGFFAPHRFAGGATYNSWAGTMDFHLPIFAHLDLTGSAYLGQALGGLGAGTYKDYVYRVNGSEGYFRTLDDMGGWLQAKQKVTERLEFNEAIGIDNVPGYQLQPFAIPSLNNYYNLARNRTFTSNVIYRPSAYLLYSIEYRRIESSFVNSPTAWSDVIGVAAGYKF